MTDTEPAVQDCDCRKVVIATRSGRDRVFWYHTYACLRARRGSRTMAEYYGAQAMPRPRLSR